MLFARLEKRDVVADFDGGAMSSDAGALLLGASDKDIRLVDRFADCFTDGRMADRIVPARLVRVSMAPSSLSMPE